MSTSSGEFKPTRFRKPSQPKLVLKPNTEQAAGMSYTQEQLDAAVKEAKEQMLAEVKKETQELRNQHKEMTREIISLRAKLATTGMVGTSSSIEAATPRSEIPQPVFKQPSAHASTRTSESRAVRFDESFSSREVTIADSSAGSYVDWNFRAEIMSSDRFVKLTELIAMLQAWRSVNFSVKAQRDQLLVQMDALSVERPFSAESRFPESITLVNIDNGAIADLLTIVRDSASFGARFVEQSSASNDKSYGSLNDARLAFSKSLTRLREIYRTTSPELAIRYGIFNRKTMESTLRITWLCD